jgi:hypothetical protein
MVQVQMPHGDPLLALGLTALLKPSMANILPFFNGQVNIQQAYAWNKQQVTFST